MAFANWRRGSKKVYVYYHDGDSGKLMQLPREQTAHLDGKPREQVEAWVEKWEKDHGRVRERSTRINLKETDTLHKLWVSYQSHRDQHRRRRKITSVNEDQAFRNHIVGFFVGIHGVKLPANWHDLVVAFHSHLFEQKLSVRTMQKVLWTLERFGKHLVWQRYMNYPFVVAIPSGKNERVTPLKVRMTPEQVMKFAKSRPTFKNQNIDFQLAVLLGYFAALSPSELFALERSDFLTGEGAETNTKTLPGFKKVDLGSRLSVAVNKTLPSKGKQTDSVNLTKNDYRRGIVNIWHPQAAKLIAKLLMAKPDGRLFPYSYGHLIRQWRENVKVTLNVTAHDLRRASGLYLGRTLRIELTLLQEHMRHAEIETTMLYAREPSTPELLNKLPPNFDDVA